MRKYSESLCLPLDYELSWVIIGYVEGRYRLGVIIHDHGGSWICVLFVFVVISFVAFILDKTLMGS